MSSAGNANASTTYSKKMWVGVLLSFAASINANQGCEMQQVWCDYWDSSHFCCSLEGFALCSFPSSDSTQPFSLITLVSTLHQVLFEWSPPLIAQTMRNWLSKVARWLSVCRGVSQYFSAAPVFVGLVRGQALCNRDLKHFFFSLKGNIIWRQSILNIKLDFHSSQSLDSVWCNLKKKMFSSKSSKGMLYGILIGTLNTAQSDVCMVQ